MKFRAWLVDLDGTLYRPLPVKLAMGAELLLLGPRHIPTLRKFRKEHERIRAEGTEVGEPYRVQVERAAAALGEEPSRVAELAEEWMQARPGKWLRRFRRSELLEEIRGFRANGGKTALVSDYPARKKLSALGVADLFDAIVASGEPGGPGALKPDPRGYLLAAEQVGIPAAECLVIGDRDDADGEAARRAGMEFRRV
jgi:FMN phosphatase YigB (HAD superfamily)